MRTLLIVGSAALAALILLSAGTEAQSTAVVSIQAPESAEAPEDGEEAEGEPVKVDITVADTPALGGYQILVTYDPDLFAFDSAERGEFLGSTGRELFCNEPVVATGAVLLVCGTIGADPEGAEGDGVLHSFFLAPRGTGDAVVSVSIDRSQLSSPEGNEITFTAEPATIAVEHASSGMNWALWGPIIAVSVLLIAGVIAALVIVLRRTRASTTTPAPLGD